MELSALSKIVEVGDLANELLEKDTALFNELRILVVRKLHVGDVDAHRHLLGDGGHVAAWPSIT